MKVTNAGALSVLMVSFGFHLAQASSSCHQGAKPFFDGSVGDHHRVSYAQLFSVTYYGTYKVVSYDPLLVYKSFWPVADEVGKGIPDLVLYQCGTDRPTLASPGVSASALVLQIPLQKAAIAWTGVLHFFEMLSVTEAIHAIDMRWISSPCMQLIENCTPGIHAPNSGAPWTNAVEGAEAIFIDSFGTGWTNTGKNVVFDMSLDPGFLHRAEWIRFAALFFNEEAAAGTIFSQIEDDYDALMAEAKELQKTSSFTSGQPVVAWVTLSWPDRHPMIRSAHFERDIVEAAGGRLLTFPAQDAPGCTTAKNTDGSQTYICNGTGAEHFQTLLGQADVIIDSSHGGGALTTIDDFTSKYGLTLATSSSSSIAMQRQAVFRNDGSVSDNGGSNWFEQMPTQPQQILSDMMHAVWGDSFTGTCDMKYLRRLYGSTEQAMQDVLDHPDCPLYDPHSNHDCAAVHDFEHTIPQCAAHPEMASFSHRMVVGIMIWPLISAVILLASD